MTAIVWTLNQQVASARRNFGSSVADRRAGNRTAEMRRTFAMPDHPERGDELTQGRQHVLRASEFLTESLTEHFSPLSYGVGTPTFLLSMGSEMKKGFG
jgi:hypothetical protein